MVLSDNTLYQGLCDSDDDSDGFVRPSPPYVLEARVDCVLL